MYLDLDMAKESKSKHTKKVLKSECESSPDDGQLSGTTMPTGKERSEVAQMPPDGRPTSVEVCREVFRDEMAFLWREVEQFRVTCRKQMKKQRRLLAELKAAADGEDSVQQQTESSDYPRELRKLQRNMSFLEKHQTILDKEQSIVDKEEQLSRRQEKLREYEQEVQNIEQMLDKRQSWCDKRMEKIEDLNHEMVTMKRDMQQTVDELETKQLEPEAEVTPEVAQTSENTGAASTRARHNWTMARRHLIDKMTLLEVTVQKYRTKLASATTAITARDLLIARRTAENNSLKDVIQERDRRIKQLESQLSFALQGQRNTEQNFDLLMDELQTMELTSPYRKQMMPPETKDPIPSNKTSKLVRIVKQQSSSISLFSSDQDKPPKDTDCKKCVDAGSSQSKNNHTETALRMSRNGMTSSDENSRKHSLVAGKQKHNSAKDLRHLKVEHGIAIASKSCVVM